MRFNCGRTQYEKDQDRKKWHRWFAWRPVRVVEGDCRWLEVVERRGSKYYSGYTYSWEYEYRSIEANE